MKFLLSCILFVYSSATIWSGDFEKSKKEALQTHKKILLNFSGSDWCAPCIRMHKDIFDSEAFQQYAQSKLILVRADFPRSKKNQLAKEQQKQNDQLADKYNPNGIFPYTLLLDENGKILKSWEGYQHQSAASFINDLKDLE